MSENFIVFILAFGFLAYISICFVHGLTGKKEFMPVSDNFKLGYIERKEPTVIEKPVVIYKEKKVKDKQQEVKIRNLEKQLEILAKRLKTAESKQEQKQQQQPKVNQLQQDCIDALIALGCKKTEAKNGVELFFKNNNVDSIEEFIVQYFKKG
jgi:hypothetical protein